MTEELPPRQGDIGIGPSGERARNTPEALARAAGLRETVPAMPPGRAQNPDMVFCHAVARAHIAAAQAIFGAMNRGDSSPLPAEWIIKRAAEAHDRLLTLAVRWLDRGDDAFRRSEPEPPEKE